MKLNLEEAIALRDFLETLCISYYEVNTRAGLKKTIIYLNELIEELTIYVEERVIDEDESVALADENDLYVDLNTESD